MMRTTHHFFLIGQQQTAFTPALRTSKKLDYTFLDLRTDDTTAQGEGHCDRQKKRTPFHVSDARATLVEERDKPKTEINTGLAREVTNSTEKREETSVCKTTLTDDS